MVRHHPWRAYQWIENVYSDQCLRLRESDLRIHSSNSDSREWSPFRTSEMSSSGLRPAPVATSAACNVIQIPSMERNVLPGNCLLSSSSGFLEGKELVMYFALAFFSLRTGVRGGARLSAYARA